MPNYVTSVYLSVTNKHKLNTYLNALKTNRVLLDHWTSAIHNNYRESEVRVSRRRLRSSRDRAKVHDGSEQAATMVGEPIPSGGLELGVSLECLWQQ